MAGFDPYFGNVVCVYAFDGADNGTTFTDEGPLVGLLSPTLIGTPKTSTVNKVFGATSLLLNGTTDGLLFANNAVWNLGTAGHTFEMWFKLSTTSFTTATLLSQHDTPTTSVGWSLTLTPTAINMNVSTTGVNYDKVATKSWTADTNWHHVVGTRVGNNLRVYLDGVGGLVTDVTGITPYTSTGPVTLGCARVDATPTYNNFFPGNIDDFRFTKTTTRYSADFAVPTGAHPTAGTVFLADFNGTNGGTTYTTEYFGRSVTDWGTNGAANLSSTAKWGSTSLTTRYFGATTFVAMADATKNRAFTFGTGDWTIEFWVRLTDASSYLGLYLDNATNTRSVYVSISPGGSVRVDYSINGTSMVTASGTTTTISSYNTWYFVGISRVGGNIYVNVNGTLSTLAGSASAFTGGGNQLKITNASSGYMYIDDLRITRGYARHTP